MWTSPELSGTLLQQGKGSSSSWRPRFFCLKGSHLFWFSSGQMKRPEGHLPLEGAHIELVTIGEGVMTACRAVMEEL